MGIRLEPEAACAGNDETWLGVVGVLTGSKDIAACVLGRLKAVRENDRLTAQRTRGGVRPNSRLRAVRGQALSSIRISPNSYFIQILKQQYIVKLKSIQNICYHLSNTVISMKQEEDCGQP